jgi:hypothetical protein
MTRVAAPAARTIANRRPNKFFMTPSNAQRLSPRVIYQRLVEGKVTKITECLIAREESKRPRGPWRGGVADILPSGLERRFLRCV